MIGLSMNFSILSVTLQLVRWGGQPLSPKSQYPSLYTGFKQVASGLEPMTICYDSLQHIEGVRVVQLTF
jgi:hypothetical protein